MNVQNPVRWSVLALLCLAQFMLIVDITVVQVALPSIGADLALDREALTWVVTTYTLCFGGLMVLGGRLADAFGARRLLVAGLALFTVASLAAGLAPNGPALIAGRALQGVGAALLSPAALSIITTAYHGDRRNRALAVWAAIGGSGAAAGVLLGGLLTAGPGWTWAFYVNVPIGLAVLAILPSRLPVRAPAPAHHAAHAAHSTAGTHAGAAHGHGHGTHGGHTAHGAHGGGRGRVDVVGGLVVTGATGLLIYGLTRAGEVGWGSAGTLWVLLAAVAGYAAFVVVERKVRAPLMRAETLARRPVLSGMFVMLMATASMLGLFFLSSLYLQHVRGFSPLETGLVFLPVAVAITAGAHVAGRLVGRIGGRPVAVAAFALTAAGAGLMAQVSADGNVFTTLLPGFVVAAFGIGPAFVTATSTTMANVSPAESGVASGVVNTFHELGGSIGVALVSSAAAAALAPGGDVSGFATALTAVAVAALVAAAVSLLLVPPGRPSGAFVGHGHGH
ncbi:MFS transporter [Nonomuraea sp. NPDC023979]|uniref:MFS transporter n=1 Tax=Nonomuraea sp. NPDC023979 TaxID=3154796 RepID=UPI003411782A